MFFTYPIILLAKKLAANAKLKLDHIKEMENQNKPFGSVIALPDGVAALRDYQHIFHHPKLVNRRLRHLIYLLPLGLILVSAGWYMASVYFSKYQLDGSAFSTRLNDQALAGKINGLVSSYKLYLKYPDGTLKSYNLTSVGLSLNQAQTITNLKHQASELSARVIWWRPIKARLVFKTNSEAFNNFINSSTQLIVQPPTDASLNIAGGNISISNAVTGKEYGLANAANQLIRSSESLNTSPLKLTTLAVSPALTAEQLAPYKVELSKTLNQPASFTINGQSFTPSASQIAEWLDITPDDKTKSLAITVNSGKVQAYIDSIAAPLIHPAKAQVNVTESDGSVQMLVAGVNGVDVINKTSIATEVSKNLLSASGFSYTLPVNLEPYNTITAGDYPKWIEVDLANKRLYAYEHANLVMTDLVTAGAPATPTVTGQYSIYAKYVSQNMHGENVDGSSYFQPNVPWINYFYKDYAIHGNYWRPLSYFGRVNSSHGCVGLRDNDAEWIYNWAPIGTPVIIHI